MRLLGNILWGAIGGIIGVVLIKTALLIAGNNIFGWVLALVLCLAVIVVIHKLP